MLRTMLKVTASTLCVLLLAANSAAQEPPLLKRLNTTDSIVDFLKANQLDHSLQARRTLYQERFGKVEYSGTHAQNVRLLESLMLGSAEAARTSFCAIDATTVNIEGAGTRRAFDALPATGLRIATLNRHSQRHPMKPQYYVVLSARETKAPDTVGHAWVAFGVRGREQADASQCIGSAFGSFPQDDKKAPLSPFMTVPGKIVQGWLKNSGESASSEKLRLVVEVDETAYVAARNIVAETKAGKEYKLLTKDCAELVRAVAEAIGLTVGERKLLPTQVVEALIQDNLPPK
jgi:hypothetical protein